MTLRHDDDPLPSVQRQPHQLRKELVRARRNHELQEVSRHHVRDLLGGTLMQMQAYFRVLCAKSANAFGQNIARLSVRRRDGQRAAVHLGPLRRCASNALQLTQDRRRPRDDVFPGFGRTHQRTALALEDLKPKLLLEQCNLAAHPGLRGVQAAGGRRHVQTVLVNRDDVAKLLEFHERSRN